MPTSVTTNSFALSPESRDVLGNELNLFENALQPRQNNAILSLLSLLSQNQPTQARLRAPGFSGAAGTLGIAPASAQAAAGQRGLQGTTQVQDLLSLLQQRPLSLVDLLRQQARGQSLRQQSLIDPRFAQFLRPVSTTRTDTETSDSEQAFQILNAILSLGGQVASNI